MLDEASPGLRPLGGAARWWLAQSLRALQASLRTAAAALVLRRGAAVDIIPQVAREVSASTVIWNEIAESTASGGRRCDRPRAGESEIAVQRFPGDLLVDPRHFRNKDGRGPRVFTPFWRRILARGDPPLPGPAPKSLNPAQEVTSETIEDWGLEPRHPDWAGGLRETWAPGECGAQARLKAFLARDLQGYAVDRDRPDRDGTSSLSPHLRFGEISPRQVWHAARFAAAERRRAKASTSS